MQNTLLDKQNHNIVRRVTLTRRLIEQETERKREEIGYLPNLLKANT